MRPYAIKFIFEVSQYYEIVIFTASIQEYADPILNDIDPQKCISHRLYRQHCREDVESNGDITYTKDLDYIGRPLKSTIIVDNLSDNFKKHSPYGIEIKDWYEDYSDDCLKKLSVLLIQIAKMRPKDMAQELRLYRNYIKEHIQ